MPIHCTYAPTSDFKRVIILPISRKDFVVSISSIGYHKKDYKNTTSTENVYLVLIFSRHCVYNNFYIILFTTYKLDHSTLWLTHYPYVEGGKYCYPLVCGIASCQCKLEADQDWRNHQRKHLCYSGKYFQRHLYIRYLFRWHYNLFSTDATVLFV